VATNGYTGPATPWQQRRVLPFDAFMVATEPLSPELMRRVLPSNRTVIDDGRNGLFVRPSPDGTRILFGGHTGRPTTEPLDVAPGLYRALGILLPDLAKTRLSHAWTGRCAGTWDLYPHIGQHDGIHYAMGYCFAGVPMGSYMGGKLAARILGRNDVATPFDDLDFPAVPLHGAVSGLTPYLLRYWEWRDSAA
jgi:glycine/D-amino acid oxidase-like deaminating enzyme